MKGSESFKKVIEQHLNDAAQQNSLFAEKLKNPDKNIDECISYIMGEVQKSGMNGFEDSEVYGMAMHYYDEKDVKVSSTKSARVVVNHEVKLTEKEIEELKAQAKERVIQEEMSKIRKKPAPKDTVNKPESEQTLFG